MFRAAASAGARAARRAFGSRAGGAAFSTAARAQAATAAFLFSNAGITAAAAVVYVAASTAACPVAYAAEKMERSFIMVKPDGVHRSLVGDIIKRFEGKGYKLVGIKVVVPSKDLASKHYAEHEGKPFFPPLVDFLSSGAVVAMVWEGKGVIKMGRTMIGATNPLASNPGTIRGDYGIDVGRNIIHGSDSVDSAQKEIALWFNADELADYDKVTSTWIYE